MPDPVSLAKARADKAQDSRLWTPLDALKDLVADIEAGRANPTSLAIHYFEDKPDGGRCHHYQVAGLIFTEHIALLTVAKHRVVAEWLG